MKWYHYVAAFFAGILMCNGLLHCVIGLSGDFFRSAFFNPRGEAFSPASVNIFRGLINLAICFFLYNISKVSKENKSGLGVVLIGFVAFVFILGIHFSGWIRY